MKEDKFSQHSVTTKGEELPVCLLIISLDIYYFIKIKDRVSLVKVVVWIPISVFELLTTLFWYICTLPSCWINFSIDSKSTIACYECYGDVLKGESLFDL